MVSEGLFGAVLDDEQRIKLARIQAFMAAAEGYGDHVTHAIGWSSCRRTARIAEAHAAAGEDEADGTRCSSGCSGVEMKREQYEAGRGFCDTVAELTDEATLARMWESSGAHAVVAGARGAASVARAHGVTGVGYPLRSMEPVGELVAAAVVDARVWDAYGDRARWRLPRRPAGTRAPLRALPRLEGAGRVRERGGPAVRSSGRTIHRWGPEVRRMAGAMDLTRELDRVENAVFDETGTYVASFILDGQIVGEIEVPVFVQASRQSCPRTPRTD